MATQPFTWNRDTLDDRIVNPEVYTDTAALLADWQQRPVAEIKRL